VKGPQPVPIPQYTPAERAGILENLKRLSNFIVNKDDPVTKTQALYKAGDDNDRKNALLLAIIGRERLLVAAKRLIQEVPDLGEFLQYVELCDSVEGRKWIDQSFDEIKGQSRLMGVTLKREEAAKLLEKVEQKLGFRID